MPKQYENESKKHYIERFMSDDMMNKKYPNPKQRYQICINEWEKRKLLENINTNIQLYNEENDNTLKQFSKQLLKENVKKYLKIQSRFNE